MPCRYDGVRNQGRRTGPSDIDQALEIRLRHKKEKLSIFPVKKIRISPIQVLIPDSRHLSHETSSDPIPSISMLLPDTQTVSYLLPKLQLHSKELAAS
jgi:hypothetical protein